MCCEELETAAAYRKLTKKYSFVRIIACGYTNKCKLPCNSWGVCYTYKKPAEDGHESLPVGNGTSEKWSTY